MEIRNEKIFCETFQREFNSVFYKFNYEKDNKLITEFIKDGTTLANKLNPVLARDSTKNREFKIILSNAIAGVISEWVWRDWLNKISKKDKLKIVFKKTELKDIKNQIDIKVEYPNKTYKSIEVRSSFPYTGIKNGICKVFDIIGWYVNKVKVKEIKKDYYLRVLFPYNVSEFDELLKKGFEAYLTGGATKEMLESSAYAKDKEFIPYNEIIESNIKKTKYRVIEPIINAKDTLKIIKMIMEDK